MFLITDKPLELQSLIAKAVSEEDGAVASFLGVVRRHSRGNTVLYMEYEAYKEMAEKVLRQIGDEVRDRWPVDQVAIHHRVGRLEIGETSLVVVVTSPHRVEAFEACRYAVERVKAIAPIWKKEVWEGGESWVEGDELVAEGRP